MAQVKIKNPIPCFTPHQLETLSKIIADTSTGLKGSELGRVLQSLDFEDIDPAQSKWVRLFNALANMQNQLQCGNHVVKLLHEVYSPDLWHNRIELFKSKRNELNNFLVFCGLHLGEDGKVRFVQKAITHTEAQLRAENLHAKLKGRDVHSTVLEFCKAELMDDNYFHAVLEATKSIADRLRQMSNLGSDGAELVRDSLSLGKNGIPKIPINLLRNDTEKSEQTGFMNLVIGLFGTFRNPTAHAAKIDWNMREEDALDILGTISLIHRKLDSSPYYANKSY